MELQRSKAITPLLALSMAIATSLALAGCDGGGASAGAGSSGEATDVPIGASAEEYAAALEGVEPTNLVFQIGSGPESRTSQPYKTFAKNVEEYSGGAVTIELVWSNAIVPNVAEIDRALMDGRVDIGVVYAALNAEQYPVNNAIINTTVLRDPRILAGTLGSAGAYEETTLGTPEALAEVHANGLTPLYMLQPESPTVMFCSEPLTSLADLQGKQIRAATPGMAAQLEGLGAVPVSMAYNEVYEALQRGILDCGMGIHALGTVVGLFEVAPYVMHTVPGAAFVSTPTPYYAGIRFSEMDPVAQQLVQEMFVRAMGESKEIQVAEIVEDGLPIVEANGGQFLTFEKDVTDRLAEVNEQLLEDVRNSSAFDGNDFIDRLTVNTDKWVAMVEDLGYLDAGDVDQVGEWYSTDLGADYTDALVENIAPLTWGARP
ncbi:hypothetical protein [Microbacterium lacus]|uniref:C4-dicarboxylate ABC transporter substrate-binding protein n=1 Tax=Microbacterium lacus TaxID=415217 RepID=A0ABN2H0I8_9MICO